ncbi:MAG TPA: hypothetical protein VFH80_32940 [Solirubrobacteraceae bacterium]|nr:hypothetical protein [Solirubrobacteraceae bacterium]
MPTITRKLPLAAALLGLAALMVLHAVPAAASTSQESIFQDDNLLKADPVGTMQTLRDLGVQRVRVNLTWNTVAPAPTSTKRPKSFNAANPAAYPAAGWTPYDAIVRAGEASGVEIDFTLEGPAPLWATGSGAPKGTTGFFRAAWQPSAKEFGLFVRAVGTRYSGTYKPQGSATAIPRVSFWSIWNEPNYGFDIAPQGIGAHQSTPNSPHVYRNLLGAAWSALQATGHRTRTDRILFGEVTPHGVNGFGVFSNMKPLIFLRSLYCVDSRYRQLRGSAAAAQGCPTTAAGSRKFRKQNPALFSASGFADHPYDEASAPNKPTHLCRNKLCVGAPSDPDFADLPEMPHLLQTLDRLNRVYGSHTRFAVWSTEYGFRTKPPDPNLGVSQSTAAGYMNQAEYLSYRQPRLLSYSQYQLRDAPPPASFDTGLENPDGSPKPGYDAYRMPLFIPTTSTRAGHKIEIWGGVRPASYARLDTGQAQSAQIQFQTGSRGAWQTIDTVTITNSKGYIDVHLALPASGAVRLAWSYPAADQLLGSGTVYSRTVNVTVR